MFNARKKRCTLSGCTKGLSFGVASKKTVEFCCEHAKDRMVNIRSRKYANRGSISGQDMARQVPTRRTSVVHTLRPGWWVSLVGGASSLAAPRSRGMVSQVLRR